MEKAILKTLIYADIFDYPMKAWEIQKWLLGRRVSFKQVEKALARLNQKSKIKNQKGYYFLRNRKGLVSKRAARQKVSEKYLRRAKMVAWFFRVIPWVKLVGVSGSLAMENADKDSDIDLFVITAKNRLWISRLGLLGMLELLGIRRKREEKGGEARGKICINLLFEEDSLDLKDKNIYLAHEVLQMRVLWEREGIYQKFLEDNEWVFKYLSNWTSSGIGQNYGSSPLRSNKKSSLRARYESRSRIVDALEKFLNWLQLRYMGKPQGNEKIQEGAVYFHPKDIGPEVLIEYKNKVKSHQS